MFEIFGLGAEFTFDSNGTERISDIVGNLQTLSSQMNLSTAQTREYANSLNEFAGVIGDMGKQLIVAGSAQTAAALYGVGKAAEWQTQMIDASRYMSDDSAAAQTEYNRQLKETAQLLGRTKEEINASVISYMMMGKSTDDALRLAKNAGYAAVTWDMTADSVADSFRTIKAAFNVNLEDQDMYQRYLDTINEVGNSTAATSQDVVAFLADGGSALHNVANVSMEQAMGMASAARYANMSIAEFSTMMIRLGNQYAQDKSTAYFEKLGINVKDANGEMRSFAEVLYDVQKQWNELDQATKSDFASGVGGVYADRLSLYMGSGEEYKKGAQIAGQDNTGSAEAEFQRVTNTFENAIARFKVTLSDFGQAFWGTLLPPLTKFINIVNKVVTSISNFMQAHPAIMKVVAGFILLTGVMTAVAGIGLTVVSMLAKLRASQVLNHFAGLRLTNIFRGIGIVFRGLIPQIQTLILKFGKLAGSMGVIYLAWKYDLFNLRSTFEEFISKFKLSMETVKKLMDNSMSVKVFQDNINKLNNSNSVFDKLTLGITKVAMAFKGLGEYIKNGSLSDDMFQKLNSLGLMPMISIIIGLGMRFKALWNGIIDGFTSAIETINTWVKDKFGPPLQWLHDHVLLPVAKAIFGVDESVQSLVDTTGGIQFVDLDAMFGSIDKWERLGKAIGVIAAGFVTLKTAAMAISGISKVASVLSTVGGWLMKFGGIIMKVVGFIGKLISSAGGIGSIFSTIGGALSTIGSAIMSALSAIGSAIGGAISAIGAPVIAIIVAVVATVVAFALKFKEQFMAIVTTIKDTFFEVIGGIVEKFQGVVESVKSRIEILKSVFEPVMERFKEAIGNVVEAFVSLKNGIVSVVQSDGFQAGWGVFTDILSAVGAIIMSVVVPAFNWLQEVLGQVVEFIVGVLGGAINGIIDIIAGVGAGIMDVFSGVINVVSGIINTIVGLIDGLIHGDFTQFFDGLKQIGTGLLDALIGVVEAITGIFGGIFDFLGGVVVSFFDAGYNIIKGLIDGIVSIGQNLWNSLKEIFTSLIDNVKSLFGIHSPSTVFSDIGGNIIQGLIDGISGLIGGVIDTFTGLFSSICDTVGGWIDSAVEWGSNLIDNIGSGIESAKEWVGEKVSGVGSWISEKWNSFTSGAAEMGSNLISGISGGIDSAVNFVTTGVSNVAEGAKGVWNAVKDNAPEWGQNLMSNIESGISGASSLVSTAISNVTTNIETTVNGIKDKALGIASDMMAKYKEGIDAGKSPVESAISTIGSTVSSGLNSLKDTALSWGSNLVDGFANGIKNAASKAANAASSVVNSVKNFLGFNSPAKMGEGQHIVEWGYNMVSGFADGIVSAEDMLSNTMANVITNPVKDAMNGVGEMPISASLTQNGTISPDSSLSGYLTQIIGLLSMIASAKNEIITSQITSSNGTISTEPLTRVQERIQTTQEAITESNTKELVVNIEEGAIKNEFHIDGDNTDKQELMEMFAEMLDSDLLPLILEKFREMKVVLNE